MKTGAAGGEGGVRLMENKHGLTLRFPIAGGEPRRYKMVNTRMVGGERVKLRAPQEDMRVTLA